MSWKTIKDKLDLKINAHKEAVDFINSLPENDQNRITDLAYTLGVEFKAKGRPLTKEGYIVLASEIFKGGVKTNEITQKK